MENTRRSFLKLGSAVGIGATLLKSPLAVLGRVATPATNPGILKFSTCALRASWPQVARLSLQIARQNVARGIVGASTAVAAALRALHRVTGKTWYDPVFRPSLRSLITGQVR